MKTDPKTKLAVFLFALTGFLFFMSVPAHAAYVTMARFDFDGDGEEEIVRTEGIAGTTSIKIYQMIENSFFYKPVQEFQIPGNLVQVPDISDLTGDRILDFYFATGSDIGVIFFDTVDQLYKRQNEVDSQVQPPIFKNPVDPAKRLSLEEKESDFYLDVEKQTYKNYNQVSYRGTAS